MRRPHSFMEPQTLPGDFSQERVIPHPPLLYKIPTQSRRKELYILIYSVDLKNLKTLILKTWTPVQKVGLHFGL